MRLDDVQKKKLFYIVAGGLLVILLVLAAVVASLNSGESPGSVGEPISGVSVPEGEILVEDMYDGETLIPKFDLPKNPYDMKKFIIRDGLTRYDDAKACMGVDVSEYQGNIDWAQVKNAGIDFAILRVGYRGMTQGLLNEDSTFQQNYDGATAAGLDVGVYFFSQAVTEAEARAEADFALNLLDQRELTYPVVFDWESPTPSERLSAEDLRAYGMSGEAVTKIGTAFCEKVKEAGYTPCVYFNKHQAYHFFDLDQWKDYDMWYAEYARIPSMYYSYRMWQYTSEGEVPGIDSGVDVNICFKPF
ncbi:MAG: glycoside hydrolase family 25 protein [Acutalibacter sp.]|nr:glycoside hydrolase family 25 protein [Acutalibacter sp.]